MKKNNQVHILILGPRKNLIRAIEKKNIPFSVWMDESCKLTLPNAKNILQKSYSIENLNLPSVQDWLKTISPITHVIAASEKSVVIADEVRKVLGCELQSNTAQHPISKLCTDKLFMKTYLHSCEIPMTKFEGDIKREQLPVVVERLKFPIVLKNKISTGGRGLKIAKNMEGLQKYFNHSQILETFIQGIEGSVESFIQDDEIIFTNITSYIEKKHCNFLPAEFSDSLKNKILQLNQTVIKHIGIQRGITHLEFYIQEDQILFGEIALRPPGGYIMDLIKLSYNIDPWSLLVDIEIGVHVNLSQVKADKFALSHVFHPGEGTIAKIHGIKESQQLKSLNKIKFKKVVGKRIERRESTGEDVGFAILVDQNAKSLIDDWRKLKEVIQFK